MSHSVKQDNVKLPFSLALTIGGGFLLAATGSLHAQIPGTNATPTNPPAAIEADPVPGNVIISTAPTPGKAAEPEKASPELAGQPRNPAGGGARFLGAASCSSSLCHGGGSPARNAFTIWQRSDPHRRAAATLAGTRAARIAQGLFLASAAGSTRCTECHTPLAGVPEERLSKGLDAQAEGVSCESCHGPAQNWVRSHTRRDFTHVQNVQTGVREVRDLYARANTCVACHQVLEPDVLAAGHPPLLFELDAQTVAEPRHWTDLGDFFGPQAWLTGQAAALRELSWALSREAEPTPEAREQWRALVWLLQRTVEMLGKEGLPSLDTVPGAGDFTPGNVAHAQANADDFARAAARLAWSRANSRRCLEGLAAIDREFVPVAGGEGDLAMRSRAQRLTLALSRLLAPLQKAGAPKWDAASKELDKLFAATDAQTIFDCAAFADRLRAFHSEVAKVAE